MRFAPYRLICLLLFITSSSIIACAGCRKPVAATPTTSSPATTPKSGDVSPKTLIESAVSLLQTSKRSPEAHQIAAQRLNQYLQNSRDSGKALIPPLNPELRRSLTGVLKPRQIQQVEAEQFDRPDSLHLENCFLNRDIVAHITAGVRDDLAKAETIFDWVIRNIQLVGRDDLPPLFVGTRITLLVGMGRELERAWTFMELLRQAGLESVLLAIHETDSETKETHYSPWLPAALVGDSLYLFDTTLGLAVPGPNGEGTATLRQVMDDPLLLSALELNSEHPYRVQADQLKRLVTLFESTPNYWAPRMRFLQGELAGQNRAVLSSDLATLAERVKATAAGEIAQDLWSLPAMVHEHSQSNEEYFRQINSMLGPYLISEIGLLDARIAHLRGKYDEAIPVYMTNRRPAPVSPPPANDPEGTARFQQAIGIYNWVRQDCTYYLGLVKFEQREYVTAANWMGKSYLEQYPTGKWVSGARYNLGRCAEARKDMESAIEYYTTADPAPQAAGNLLRARRLGWKPESASTGPKENSSTPAESAKESPQ